MGHVVNPFLYRLNYTSNSNISMLSKKKFTMYFDLNGVIIYKFLYYYFRRINFKKKFYGHIFKIKLVYVNNSLKIFLVFKKHRLYNLKLFKSKLLYFKCKKKIIKKKVIKKIFYKFNNFNYLSLMNYLISRNKTFKKTKNIENFKNKTEKNKVIIKKIFSYNKKKIGTLFLSKKKYNVFYKKTKKQNKTRKIKTFKRLLIDYKKIFQIKKIINKKKFRKFFLKKN